MDDEKKQPIAEIIKWTRIIFIVCLVLSVFYLAFNFKVYTVPDDFIRLHPSVLPGEKWVYKRSSSIHKNLFRGNLAVYREDADGIMVSLVAGKPGDRVEYLPETREFRVNDKKSDIDFRLSGEWIDAPGEEITLGPGEYLLIDSNALPDTERYRIVRQENLIGKFLFRLPF